ncbi:MAG: hypothetical protein ACTHYM_00535, partial [Actinomycetaceae bacterium]
AVAPDQPVAQARQAGPVQPEVPALPAARAAGAVRLARASPAVRPVVPVDLRVRPRPTPVEPAVPRDRVPRAGAQQALREQRVAPDRDR